MAGMDSTHQGPPPGSTTLRDNDRENDSSDFQHFLKQLSERASRFAINLDNRVERDTTKYSTGGDAIVYSGKLLPERTLVAVKTYRFGHKSDREVLKNFLRETHLWSKLIHPNVLPLLGITTKFDSTISIISKWMSKGNAHDYVQDPKVDPRPLLLGIARGLDYLHSRSPNPVYHGDLKGLNVLISDEGHALLTDFGLSYLVNSSFSMSGQQRCGGSLNWMPPEVLNTEGNVEVTPARDVWSFGMTTLELFTRKDPFHETLYRIHVFSRILKVVGTMLFVLEHYTVFAAFYVSSCGNDRTLSGFKLMHKLEPGQIAGGLGGDARVKALSSREKESTRRYIPSGTGRCRATV